MTHATDVREALDAGAKLALLPWDQGPRLLADLPAHERARFLGTLPEHGVGVGLCDEATCVMVKRGSSIPPCFLCTHLLTGPEFLPELDELRQATRAETHVLIPVPPEPFCLKGLVLMLGVIDEVRRDGHQGNPYLQVLGVLPTKFDQRWPDHRVWHTEMVEVCRERQVSVFPPIPRRQSYTRLSVAGHDYRPVADAIRALVTGAHSNPSA